MPDPIGGERVSYESAALLWARIAPVRVALSDAADHLEQRISHEVVVRFRGDISVGDRFLFRERILMIRTVIDETEERRFLLCGCEEVAP